MRLYKLAINDFQVCKVNFGNHITSLPGLLFQYRQFFTSMKSLYTQYRKIFSYLKKRTGCLFHTICQKHGKAFIRGDAFIRGNTVGICITYQSCMIGHKIYIFPLQHADAKFTSLTNHNLKLLNKSRVNNSPNEFYISGNSVNF